MKHETIEEAAEAWWKYPSHHISEKKAFIEGAKWQAERMISQEAYEDSLNLQRASNAGYESKIKELENKIQDLQSLTT
jgi:hypothetical protein